MTRNGRNHLIEIQDCLDRLVIAQEYLLMAVEQFNVISDDRILNNRLHLLLSAFLDEWQGEISTLLAATAGARAEERKEPNNLPPFP